MHEDKNIQEMLEPLKEDSGYRVPPNYFDSLSSRISERISSAREPAVKGRSWLDLFRPQLAFAFLFIGVAMIGYIGYDFVSGRFSLKYLNEDMISEYISYHQSPALDFELAEFMSENENEDWFTADAELEDIIDYLDLQEIDLQSIINEF